MIERDKFLALQEASVDPAQLVPTGTHTALQPGISGLDRQVTSQLAMPTAQPLTLPPHSNSSSWLSLAGASSVVTLVLIVALLIPRGFRWSPAFHWPWLRHVSAGH